jgi:hypothetical protein
LLASRKGEGILGVTYSMSGPTDDLSFTPQPLSILTPGIFRRLFEGKMPSAANAPSNLAAGAAGANQEAQKPPAPPAGAQAQQR